MHQQLLGSLAAWLPRERTRHAQKDSRAVVGCRIGHDVQGCQPGLPAGAHKDEHLQRGGGEERKRRGKGGKGRKRGEDRKRSVPAQFCRRAAAERVFPLAPELPLAPEPASRPLSRAIPTRQPLLWQARAGPHRLDGGV